MVKWEDKFSKRSKQWQMSSIRGLFPLEEEPGVISVLGGKPHDDASPLSGLTLEIKPNEPGGKPTTLQLSPEEVKTAMQYGASGGYAPLIKWLKGFETELHGRTNDDWNLCVGAGAGPLLNNLFLALVDPGDVVIIPSPTYGFAEAYLRTVEVVAGDDEPSDPNNYVRVAEVETGGKGLDSIVLEQLLSTWPSQRRKPKLLYLVPTGSNPTGETIPEAERLEILRICAKYDLLVLEDDPYFWSWYSSEPRPRSFFGLEEQVQGAEGRVIRVDSFSKVFGGGLRLSFVSAHPKLVEKVVTITSNTSLQTSTTTQVMIYKLLSHYGHQGLLAHCSRTADLYRARRDMAQKAAEELLSEVADWVTPQAGFFLFLKLRVKDSKDLISGDAFKAGFLAAPGAAFMGPGQKSSHVRVSFSLVDEQTMREAFKRLRGVCLQSMQNGTNGHV